MTRSELVERIAAKMNNMTFNLNLKEIDSIVSVFFNKITETLSAGDRVEIRGFGAFSVRGRKPRIAINPKNKNKVEVPSKNIVHFKTGKELHDRLNG
ncbi:MAG: integration host factor subunit beta [Alphaproteobacteria bacterium]|nr:integration host factor subunit beta [Alphaproteobacteria bacterium]